MASSYFLIKYIYYLLIIPCLKSCNDVWQNNWELNILGPLDNYFVFKFCFYIFLQIKNVFDNKFVFFIFKIRCFFKNNFKIFSFLSFCFLFFLLWSTYVENSILFSTLAIELLPNKKLVCVIIVYFSFITILILLVSYWP